MSLNLKSFQFTFIVSFLQFLLFSTSFLKMLWNLKSDFIFIFLAFILLVLVINLIFTILLNKFTYKWLPQVLFITSATALYFINNYGIYIDRNMIGNVFETNTQEVKELFTLKLLIYIFFLGLLPSYFTHKINVIFKSFGTELSYKFFMILSLSIMIIFIIVIGYKKIVPFGRCNKHLRHLLVPINYIVALIDYQITTYKGQQITPEMMEIAYDATISSVRKSKKELIIFVVGEAARAQNFSLNGYARNTNEPLKYDVINFSNFSSCGTSTFVSVPCMFSHLTRKDFSPEKGRNYFNVLDILSRLGVNVIWLDNNYGCKEVCNRITSNFYYNLKCDNHECYDEIMLDHIANNIKQDQDNFIILHQRGSHGPAYYLRVPDKFKIYKPTCDTASLDICTYEEIVNTYDNTIYYTSHFLNKSIELLEQYNDSFNTALIYVSDHGESLGEKGIYLHGFPYIIAPEEQTHIPAIIWMSRDFIMNHKINHECMISKKDKNLSHDYIFHTLLGIFNVQTNIYNKSLDLFNGCKD